MFSWTSTQTEFEDSAIVSDLPGPLIDERTCNLEGYIIEFEQAFVENLKPKHVLKNHNGWQIR